ncbi:nedd8-activating enzyme e1 catalytic subunit [Anaeramoeba ignava]|uniref:NEDD8-activating enzyme E1 catalytic subunit n=1 Tax=Anaeramoeba ignava TaxID=1746090 RepID=A0A9Q0LTA6_ANAIG|nr:nedd8-activating enzyme e1 catalytic subunit [Anaeramoeba ignava]|eukprot:Anaeramoba_ignava/a480002_224.p1 GENE.a480002_224~~a480002_224.p1  ORF type:complete len:424 (-),score=140.92 a480002_224:66-1337(-)
MEVELNENERWEDLDHVLLRTSPLAGMGFTGEIQGKENLFNTTKILVLGAGGLGCEMLKDLALSGFRDIHVIDLDTIDLSNLNRQFLFQQQDIGKPKAEVASRFIMERVPGCKVTPHHCALETFDQEFYSQFQIVISGLDNIPARRWLNSMLVNIVAIDDDGNPDPKTIIPLIDGGSEGFKGQIRVMIPRFGSCFECQLDAFPPETKFPMCTIRNTPRNPEHCIEYAYAVQWPRDHENVKADGDNPAHIQEIYENALERAKSFNIEGVTYMKTQGMVKNIIPAIASTNAIIAAGCVNEAFKLITQASNYLNNFTIYNGVELYTYTFEYEKKPDCLVCGTSSVKYTGSKDMLLKDFIEFLKSDKNFKLVHPSIRKFREMIYMKNNPDTFANLEKKMGELFENGDELTLTDKAIPSVLRLKVFFN